MSEARTGRVFGAVMNYGLGGMIPKVVNFVLLPLYSVYITPEEYGTLEVYLGAQALVLVLMRGGLSSAVARLMFDHEAPEAFASLVRTVFLTSIVFSACVVAAFYAGFQAFAGHFFGALPVTPWLELVLIASVGQLWMEFHRRILQVQEESGAAARLAAGQAVLTTVLSVGLVIALQFGALGVLIASAVSVTIYALVALRFLRPYMRSRFSRPMLKEALRYGLPLVPHHFFAWGHNYAGRWVLAAITTVAATGYLGFAARLSSPLVMITGAFSTAYSPVYFSWRTKLDDAGAHREADSIARSVIGLGAIAVVALTLGAIILFRWVTAAQYLPALGLVGPLAIAAYLQLLYTLVVAELFYAKRTKILPVIFLATVIANLTALATLAPQYGALGAVVAQLIGSVVSLVAVSLLARQTFRLPFRWRSLVVGLACSGIACVVAPMVPQGSLFVDIGIVIGAAAFLAGCVLVFSGDGKKMIGDGLWLAEKIRSRILPRGAAS